VRLISLTAERGDLARRALPTRGRRLLIAQLLLIARESVLPMGNARGLTAITVAA
jgi:hypothetical protein